MTPTPKFIDAGGDVPVAGADRSSLELDREIGGMVRKRRMERRVSQEKLSELIGVSFQQLQKYEAGTNRIGASRLFDIAVALETPIGYFFGEAEQVGDGVAVDAARTRSLSDILEDAATFEIVHAFLSINDHHLRRQVVDVLETFYEKVQRDARRAKK